MRRSWYHRDIAQAHDLAADDSVRVIDIFVDELDLAGLEVSCVAPEATPVSRFIP